MFIVLNYQSKIDNWWSRECKVIAKYFSICVNLITIVTKQYDVGIVIVMKFTIQVQCEPFLNRSV